MKRPTPEQLPPPPPRRPDSATIDYRQCEPGCEMSEPHRGTCFVAPDYDDREGAR